MILVDGPSSVSGDRWLAGLNRPADGVIAVVAAPGSHAFWALESSILSRLGLGEAASGSTANDRRTLAIWAEAYQVSDVIVIYADHYPGNVLAELGEVFAEIGVQLWLVVEPALIEAVAIALDRASTPATRLDWAAFERTWRERTHAPGMPRTSSPIALQAPSVPARGDDAVALKRIHVALGRRCDVPYLTGFCEIANDATRLSAYVRAARGAPASVQQTKLLVAARLRGLAASHRDPACFAQAISGSAVAIRRLGWSVSLDERALAAACDTEPVPAPVDAGPLSRLRRIRDPQIAAAAGLSCLGLAIHEMADVRLRDLSEDVAAIDLVLDSVPVPVELRAILRAQRISRLHSGSDPSHRLLAEDERSPTRSHVALLVRMGLGLAVGSRAWKEVLAAPARDERWLSRHGVTIRRLKYERLRTADRIRSDGLRDEAIRALRAGRASTDPPCMCPEQHVKPKLADETFGARPRQPVSMSHPWRTPW